MIPPAIPPDEGARLAELRGLSILDTPAEERFDRITRLAIRLFEVPIALVSLVDETRQWFKSSQGLEVAETSREISFCGHAILGDRVLVVPDATKDVRFADNPLVTGDTGIRFYSGYPLRSASGVRYGTLCVLDRTPRQFSEVDQRALEDLGALVENELRLQILGRTQVKLLEELSESERRAAVDTLTRLWTRDVALRLLDATHEKVVREHGNITVGMIDVDHFKRVNDQHGHATGDEVLRTIATRMRRAVRPYDVLGRCGGEEFLLVMAGCDATQAGVIAERVRAGVSSDPAPTAEGPLAVSVSIGLCTRTLPSRETAADLMKEADRALYQAKAGGRDRVVAALVKA